MGSLVALRCISSCHHDVSIPACQFLACLIPETCISSRDQEPAANSRENSKTEHSKATNTGNASTCHGMPLTSSPISQVYCLWSTMMWKRTSSSVFVGLLLKIGRQRRAGPSGVFL